MNKITKFRFFTIPEYEKEQDWLRKEHNEGWEFYGVTFPGFYHFRKCEPKDVIYQLDYNPEGNQNKSSYIQIFQDCDWEYIADFMGYTYFRKPVEEMYYGEVYYSYDELKEAIDKYIGYYNKQRIKEKLGWMSPVEYRLSQVA